MLLVPCEAVRVADAGAAEDVEGAADGDIDATVAEVVSALEVVERAGTSGVGDGAAVPLAEEGEQFLVHACAFPFHVSGVDEEFGAEGSQQAERFVSDGEAGGRLPAVHEDAPAAVRFPAAGEVDDERCRAGGAAELGEAVRQERSVCSEEPRRDDDVGGSGGEPCGGVFRVDAAAELEAARPCGEGSAGRGFIALAEHDDVAACEVVLPVEIRVEFRWVIADEIRGWGGAIVLERATDDLFDAAVVEVDAGSEAGHGGRGGNGCGLAIIPCKREPMA